MITKQEIWRKVIHLSSLVYPILYANFLEKSQIVTIISVIFFALIATEFLRKFDAFNKLFCKMFAFALRSKEMSAKVGATYFIAGILITTLLFEKKIAIISMSVLIISDTFASIIGISFAQKLPMRKIFAPIFAPFKKSVEGFLAFAISCFAILMFAFGTISPVVCGVVAVAVAFVELVSQKCKIDDNLSIPIACATLLYFVI